MFEQVKERREFFYYKGITFVQRPPLEGADVLWRLEARSYSRIEDADAELYSSYTVLEMYWFAVMRRTPKGCWILADQGDRFVRLDARKRFATPTIKEAVESFIARQRRRERIYTHRLQQTKDNLYNATQYIKKHFPEVEPKVETELNP